MLRILDFLVSLQKHVMTNLSPRYSERNSDSQELHHKLFPSVSLKWHVLVRTVDAFLDCTFYWFVHAPFNLIIIIIICG